MGSNAGGACVWGVPRGNETVNDELLVTIVRCVRKYPEADEIGVAAYIRSLVEEIANREVCSRCEGMIKREKVHK